VPSGSVAGGLANLVEPVYEGEQAPLGIRLELEAKGLLLAPAKLEHGWRIEPDHLALDGRPLTLTEAKAEWCPRRSFPFDVGRKPGDKVLRVSERTPDLLRWVRKFPSESQLPTSICLFESSVHVDVLHISLLGVGHRVEVPFEIVEARRPKEPVRLEPFINGAQGLRANTIEAALGVHAHIYKARLSKHAQMLGDGGLADREPVHKVANGALPFAKQVEDAHPIRFSEHLERSPHNCIDITNQLYSCQVMDAAERHGGAPITPSGCRGCHGFPTIRA